MSSSHTSDFHLDVYLDGIREKFGHLNQKLDEARNQRDEYKRNYMNLAKELQELRKTVVAGTSQGACEHCQFSLIADDDYSPTVSSSSESYFSIDKLEDTSLSLQLDIQSDPDATDRNVEYNHETKIAREPKLVHTLSQIATPTLAASFSMDGKYLATVSQTGIVQIFDVETAKRLSIMRDLYESGPGNSPMYYWYWCSNFSNDSKFLATGQASGDVKIWIVSERRVRNAFKHQDRVHGLDFSPNGQFIAIASGPDVIIQRLRDGFSRVLRQSDLNDLWSVRFSKDGRYIASGGSHWICVWDVRMGECVASHRVHAVRDLFFTPDGKGLLSGSAENMVIYWDVSWLGSTHEDNTDDPKAEISSQDSTGGLMEMIRFSGHKGRAPSVSVSPDGRWIASGSSDATVRIWNAHTATLQCILGALRAVRFVDFSRIGNYLAVMDEMGQATIWDYGNL